MNLEQLRYVCAIYETGSISRAAEKLFLSQPNISNAIGKLERELGFDILVRSHTGVRFTDRGLELVRHASCILEQCGTIRQLQSTKSIRHFRVITPRYAPVDQAFIRLCALLEQEGRLQQMDMRLTEANWMDSLPALHKERVEIAVTCVPAETVRSAFFRSSLEQHGVEYCPLATTGVMVKLRKGHPLLSQQPFPFERLSEYPMTEYSAHSDTMLAYGGIKLPFGMDPSHIYVDSGRTRSRLIAATDAWGIAMKMPKDHQDEYNIRYVEFPDSAWSVGYLRRQGHPVDSLERQFLALLTEELNFLKQD